MLIDFSNLNEMTAEHFKGGEKTLARRVSGDDACTVMQGRLIPGASIGMHTHVDSCEVIYVISGTASFVFNGEPETVEAGQAHYCPKGGTHTMKNNGDCDLVFLAVVPKQ